MPTNPSIRESGPAITSGSGNYGSGGNGSNTNGSDSNTSYGGPNTSYVPPNLNTDNIPNQNTNTFTNPSGSGPNFNGNTTVDTASLTAFANWVTNELTGPLQKLKPQLDGVQVEPGSFYWADYIRSYVNGTSPTNGMKNQFITVIEDLLNGLAGIASGTHALAKKYTTTEELNKAAATNLGNDMADGFANASSSFNHLGSDGQSGSGSGGGAKSG